MISDQWHGRLTNHKVERNEVRLECLDTSKPIHEEPDTSFPYLGSRDSNRGQGRVEDTRNEAVIDAYYRKVCRNSEPRGQKGAPISHKSETALETQELS